MPLTTRRAIAPYLLALGLAAVPDSVSVQTPPQPEPGDATFVVFLQSRDMGRERVSLRRTADGWAISSEGALSPPLDMMLSGFDAQYAADWKPRSLFLSSTARGAKVEVRTTFKGTVAETTVTTLLGDTPKTDTVAADTIILPNNVFGAYEAIAARLSALAAGAELSAYVAPQAEIKVRLDSVTAERVQTAARTFTARRHKITIVNPGGPLAAEVWSDDRLRLLRVTIPAASIDVVRTDIASVAARVQTLAREGDEDARIQSAGFSLAATISKPPNLAAKQRIPAVILVPGSGPTDRDETVAGIPIFGQLAGSLADAGFLVVRYDKRGVAQSGGRTEASTLTEYAEDVRAIVKYLSERKDVDDRRVAVAGHSEGGLVALLAASREKKIGAVALIATPGTTGAELVLEQQRHALDRMKLPDAERQAKIDLQQKIHEAVASGKGWEGVPPAVRRQADTPWFQSFLAFDPAAIVPKVRQPLFIAHGELDRQVPVAHARRLAELAKARKNGGEAKLVTVPDVNHLLTPAKTGEVDEYGVLETKTISRQIVDALVAWLQAALPPRS